MNENVSLLVHPRPRADESAVGYLLRLGHENELHTLFAIRSALKIKTSVLAGMGAAGIYRLVMGTSVDQSHCASSRGHKIYGQKRICPACLSTYGYMRSEWQRPSNMACHEHRIRLVDHCDRCKQPLNYNLGGLFRCNCGQDLRRIQTHAAPDWVDAFHAIFSPGGVAGESSSFKDDHVGSENEIFRVLKIVLDMGRVVGILPPKARSTRTSSMTECEWSFIGGIVDGWPISLVRLMAEAIQNRNTRYRVYLTKIFKETSLSEVSRAVEPLLKLTKECGRNAQIAKVSKPLGEEMASLYRFQKITKMLPSKAKELFDRGEFSRSAMTFPGRMRWIGVEEIDAVKRWHATTLSLNEGAQIMSCTPAQLGSLIRAGHLSASRHIHLCLAIRVCAKELLSFLEKLKQRASAIVATDNAKLVTLTEIPIGKNEDHTSRQWRALIEAIRQREIQLYQLGKPEAGLGNFAVLRTDLERPRKLPVSACPRRAPMYRPRPPKCS